MANIIPFKSVRPSRNKVHLLCSRPFYTYKKSHLKAKLESNPYSFLHVINPEYDKVNKTDPNSLSRFKLVKKKYEDFKKNKFLIKDQKPNIYLYRQTTKHGIFKGIIAGASVHDYQKKIIKKHENTIHKRESIFKNYLKVTEFHAEPVLLAYKPTSKIQEIINNYILERPEYEFTTTDKKVHELWLIDNEIDINKIIEEFKPIKNIYIADGHHRIASSLLYQKENQESILKNHFLSFFIDQSDLKIFEYNRIIKNISPLNENDFLNKLKDNFQVSVLTEHQAPKSKEELSVYINKRWYLLKVKSEKIMDNYKSHLNSQIVSDFILKDILNIDHKDLNNNIEYIKGNQPLSFLVNKINQHKNSLGIQLYPHIIEEITSIADKGENMPAKSTWIEPKLRSGLTIYEY
jgi:uncharacterized protein (DUF1015 family)